MHAQVRELVSEAHRGHGTVELIAHCDSPPLSVSDRTTRRVRQRSSLDAEAGISGDPSQHGVDILWSYRPDCSSRGHTPLRLRDVPDRRNPVPLYRPSMPINLSPRCDNPDARCTTRDATTQALPSRPIVDPDGIRHLQLDQDHVPERLATQIRCRIKPSHPLTIRPVPLHLGMHSSTEIVDRDAKPVPCSPMAATHTTSVSTSGPSLNPAAEIQDSIEGEQRHVVQVRLPRARERRRLHLDQVQLGQKLDLRTQ